MSEICPYCGTRSPGEETCRDCGGFLDDLSATATQISMGPWYFRVTGKPWGPGCSVEIIQRLARSGKIKPGSQVRGPETGQLWYRAENVPGLAHLTGRCHECYADVQPNAKSCFGCGTEFPTLKTGRDALGIDDPNAAIAIEQQRKVDARTCPRCASEMPEKTFCDHCDAMFDPKGDTASIALGPWFIRSKGAAYFPGTNYQHVRQMIDACTVTASTIVRGPTTEQFWKCAKDTEGIAHHVGFCHECEAEVTPHASTCLGCGTSFSDPTVGDALGLRFKTADEIASAQRTLDDELKEIAASNPEARPIVSAVKPKSQTPPEPEYEEYEELDSHDAHSETHNEHDHEYDSHEEHEEHEHTHDPLDHLHAEMTQPRRHSSKRDHLASHLESVAEQPNSERDDHHSGHRAADQALNIGGTSAAPAISPHDLAASVNGGPAVLESDIASHASGTSTADAKIRRQKSQFEQNKSKLVAVGVISSLLLIVVVIVIVSGGLDGGGTNTPTTDSSAKDASKDNANSNSFASDDMLNLRRTVEERWKTTSTVTKTPAFSGLLTNARDRMFEAREQFGKQAYYESEQEYVAAGKAMDGIDVLLNQQATALQERRRAVSAQATAKEFDVDSQATDQWQVAIALHKQAEAELQKEAFADAATSFENAIDTLGKATQLVQHRREANDARASIAKEIKRRYNEQHLEQFGGEPWQRVVKLLKEGDDYVSQKQFPLGIQKYQKVRSLFSQIDIGIRRGRGRRFYAYQAGRHAAKLVALRWKGTAVTDEQFGLLKQQFANLQMPSEFILALPTDGEMAPNDFAQALILQAKEKLQAQFSGDGGDAVAISFNIGINATITDQLHETELGSLSLRTKNEIRITLKLLRKLLADAGWNRQATGMLDAYETTLVEEQGKSEKTRAAWKDLLAILDKYETGQPLTRSEP